MGDAPLVVVCWPVKSLLMVLPAAAQLEVGDNWSMNLSGDIGYNYHGNISDGLSGHSMGFSGDANLNGSYYNPNS